MGEVVKVQMTTLRMRPTTLCRSLDTFSNVGISSWLTSFFQWEVDKVPSPTNQNGNISSNNGFSSQLSSLFQREKDKKDSAIKEISGAPSKGRIGSWLSSFFQRRDGKMYSPTSQSKAIVKLQSLIRGYVVRKHYTSLMRDENPPLRTIRYFSRLLDPVDSSFSQQIKLNLLKDEFASNLKNIYIQKEKIKSLEKDIGLLVKDKIVQQELLSRLKKLTSKNKYRVERVINMKRQAVCEAIKNREKVDSYEHLFYCLQTNPKYLTRLIGHLSGPEDKTIVVDRLLHSLYNDASTPREEYFFVTLMEGTLREEVETRLDAIEDVWYGRSRILKLIARFYTHQANYNGLVEALTPAIGEILSVRKNLAISATTTSHQYSEISYLIERQRGETIYETPLIDNVLIYNMADELVDSILSYVDSIPYGLRYLTKVLQKSLQTKFPEGSEDAMLRAVSWFLFQYLEPAIDRSDLFDLITPVQRDNLVHVSRIIRQTMKVHIEKSLYEQKRYIYLCRTIPRFRKFFHNVLNVPELNERFNFNMFVEAIQVPVVKIPAEEIINIHSLLSTYEDVVFRNYMDIAYKAFKDIGKVPHVNDLLATDAAEYDNAEERIKICLQLSSKFPLLHDFNTEMENLMVVTKKLALDVIRLVPGETLQDVLMTPISPAQEEQHRALMGGALSTRANDPQDITESHNLSLQTKCYKISENLKTLQKVCAFSGVRNHQDFLNLIARESKEKHKLSLERQSETRTIQKILEVLCKQVDDLQNLEDQYKRYWENCKDNLLWGESCPSYKARKVRFEYDVEIIYNAKQLVNMGVIVNIRGLWKWRYLKDQVLYIKPAGDFIYVRLGMQCVHLPVADVLRRHHSRYPRLDLFHYEVDIGKFLFLVTKYFGI
ncbi:ras GTPase-activating-like protein IQGAP1 [Lithobates pipiens]